MIDVYQPFRLRGNGGVELDGLTMICGKLIGKGIDREVYEYIPDPENQVIKVETGMGNFQNVVEMLTWHATLDNGPQAKSMQKYLAKVFQISMYGVWLRMERTHKPPPNFKWPAKMPAFLTDFKRDNFGLTSDGRLVCHDYGTNLCIPRQVAGRAMHKADWWD